MPVPKDVEQGDGKSENDANDTKRIEDIDSTLNNSNPTVRSLGSYTVDR